MAHDALHLATETRGPCPEVTPSSRGHTLYQLPYNKVFLPLARRFYFEKENSAERMLCFLFIVRMIDLEQEMSSTEPLTFASSLYLNTISGGTPHHIIKWPSSFIFFHEKVYQARVSTIVGAMTVSLQIGLDHPLRVASEFLQGPVNDGIILHISWPERKQKCPCSDDNSAW